MKTARLSGEEDVSKKASIDLQILTSHPPAKTSLKTLRIKSAKELAEVVIELESLIKNHSFMTKISREIYGRAKGSTPAGVTRTL